MNKTMPVFLKKQLYPIFLRSSQRSFSSWYKSHRLQILYSYFAGINRYTRTLYMLFIDATRALVFKFQYNAISEGALVYAD